VFPWNDGSKDIVASTTLYRNFAKLSTAVNPCEVRLLEI
jgi:hypothetical protein